jgi:hypothetical protein
MTASRPGGARARCSSDGRSSAAGSSYIRIGACIAGAPGSRRRLGHAGSACADLLIRCGAIHGVRRAARTGACRPIHVFISAAQREYNCQLGQREHRGFHGITPAQSFGMQSTKQQLKRLQKRSDLRLLVRKFEGKYVKLLRYSL